MKRELSRFIGMVVCGVVLAANVAFAQGTAFTYQGKLTDSATAANGSYDLRFILYDNTAGGSQQGPILTNTATTVTNGLFTVILDFGNVFPGANRFLEIAVRTNGNGSFIPVNPRQSLTPAPYAITAGSVAPGSGLAGTYGSVVTLSNAANQITGSFTGNGVNVTNVNAATVGGLSPTNFWQLGGNSVSAGQFIGSSNNQAVEIRANNQTMMRLAYASNVTDNASPNLIGGSSANFVSNGVVGATVSGGGFPGLQHSNSVTADYGTVLGGYGNVASGRLSIAGGYLSRSSGTNSVALGSGQATGTYSVALGQSYASANYSLSAGAAVAEGDFSTALNSSEADGAFSFSAGDNSWALYDGCFVWADHTGPLFVSNTSNQFLVRATGGFGINTSLPSPNMLTVATANSAYGMEQTDGNIRVGTYVGGSTGGGWIGTISNHKFSLYVNSGPPTMTLNTNGLVGIGTTTPSSALQVIGTVTATTFNPASDRNLKENFTPVSPREVLDKVTALPITRWNFKDDASVPHLGPMAQDFHAAFALGTDDKHIATVDESGVALAAIQGLNEKVEAREKEIVELKSQNLALEKRLEALEKAARHVADR